MKRNVKINLIIDIAQILLSFAILIYYLRTRNAIYTLIAMTAVTAFVLVTLFLDIIRWAKLRDPALRNVMIARAFFLAMMTVDLVQFGLDYRALSALT